MKHLCKTFARTMAASLLVLSSMTGVASAAPSGTSLPIGGELPSATQLTGKVVCVSCSVEDVQKAHPDSTDLYLLKHVGHEQEKLVFELTKVTDPQRWSAIVFPSVLLVRSTDSLFHKLAAEKNLFKQVTLVGVLHSDRVLDVAAVTVKG